MGKRKAGGGKPFGHKEATDEDFGPSKFGKEEQFEDSEDEFYTHRDQILFDEGPDAKRRRRMKEAGMSEKYGWCKWC